MIMKVYIVCICSLFSSTIAQRAHNTLPTTFDFSQQRRLIMMQATRHQRHLHGLNNSISDSNLNQRTAGRTSKVEIVEGLNGGRTRLSANSQTFCAHLRHHTDPLSTWLCRRSRKGRQQERKQDLLAGSSMCTV